MADWNERMISIEIPIAKFNVWTKQVGINPRIKLLLLHGDPGATHELFKTFENFLPDAGIEFYYYDQLGSFFSDKSNDNSLWTVERFVDEVEQVRKALGLNKNNFYLLGHSWGEILLLEYALLYQNNLKSLIISNMMSSATDYAAYAENVLAKRMNPLVLKTIRTVTHLNNEIYTLMQGPSEFGISGLLEKWNRKDDLPKIQVRTLTIGATFDTMDPEHMKWMATQLQNGSVLICLNGSHCSMWDNQ